MRLTTLNEFNTYYLELSGENGYLSKWTIETLLHPFLLLDSFIPSLEVNYRAKFDYVIRILLEQEDKGNTIILLRDLILLLQERFFY